MLGTFFSDPLGFLLELAIRLPAVLISLSFHEWAHAFAAYKMGDPTARNLGRMTLDPLKHIDILGLICMALFRFGWAKPVPVNPRNYRNPRRDDIIVSLAGVAMNFCLANAAMLVVYLLTVSRFSNEIVTTFLLDLLFINLGLMIFNLIPVPPLDGYHVLRDLFVRKINPRFFWTMERYGYYILMGLLLIGALDRVLSVCVSWLLQGMDTFYSWIFALFV